MTEWLGRKVARLPARGTLLFATDLQGNLRDYERMKAIYAHEKEAGNDPILLFAGDLVHGPGEDLRDPASWPEHLGTHYEDRSAELVYDLMEVVKKDRVVSLIGNHEHAHVGGPTVSKFHADEGAALEVKLGDRVEEVRDFFRSLPLIAVAPCGAAFTHGAPGGTQPSLEAFDALAYDGFERRSIQNMHQMGTVGAILWARYASPEAARAFLRATSLRDRPNAFVAYGHDVVHDGYEKVGREQICISTSFGLYDEDKVYLRLDLAASYESVEDLREGEEILPLY